MPDSCLSIKQDSDTDKLGHQSPSAAAATHRELCTEYLGKYLSLSGSRFPLLKAGAGGGRLSGLNYHELMGVNTAL